MYVKYSKNVNTKKLYGHLFKKEPPRETRGGKSFYANWFRILHSDLPVQ